MHINQGWTNSNLLSCSIPEIFFFQVVASWFGFFTWVERIHGSFVLCRLWWRAYTGRYFIVIYDAIICWMDNIYIMLNIDAIYLLIRLLKPWKVTKNSEMIRWAHLKKMMHLWSDICQESLLQSTNCASLLSRINE